MDIHTVQKVTVPEQPHSHERLYKCELKLDSNDPKVAENAKRTAKTLLGAGRHTKVSRTEDNTKW